MAGHRGPDLVGRARWWLAASLVALVLAAAGLVVRGPNFGVEFTGGRLLEYRTERPVDLDAARQALAEAGHPRAVVQASGEGNLTVRTGQLDEAGEEQVQRAVTEVGGQVTELRDEFIGPTIGAELRRKALIALGIALVVQLGYLAVRFRWTFGAAAVVAMFHDVAILLGLFAWLGKPLDGVFLAALLTVIGYSVNDSVVVFDRIRERLRARTREPLDRLANDACLQTIPHGQHRAGRAVHPGRPVRARRRHPDRLRPGPAGRDPGRDLLVGVRGHPAARRLRGRFGGPPPAPRRPAPAREPVPAGTTPKARDAGASRQGTGARPRPKAPRPKPRPKAGRRGNGRRR